METILVTGASSGIGRAVSQKLLSDGYAVLGVSRSIKTTDIAHPNFTALSCDLCDFEQLKAYLKPYLKNQCSIAGAIFCAGTGYFGSLEQLDFSRIEALIRINLLSPMFLSKLLIPAFKTRKAGRMIYIGSEAALRGTKNGTAYCASKFGLRGFVQALGAEAGQAGVNITLINPGMVDTPFFDDLRFEPGDQPDNAIAPETIATCVSACLKVDQNSVIEEINLSPRNKVIAFK